MPASNPIEQLRKTAVAQNRARQSQDAPATTEERADSAQDQFVNPLTNPLTNSQNSDQNNLQTDKQYNEQAGEQSNKSAKRFVRKHTTPQTNELTEQSESKRMDPFVSALLVKLSAPYPETKSKKGREPVVLVAGRVSPEVAQRFDMVFTNFRKPEGWDKQEVLEEALKLYIEHIVREQQS